MKIITKYYTTMTENNNIMIMQTNKIDNFSSKHEPKIYKYTNYSLIYCANDEIHYCNEKK